MLHVAPLIVFYRGVFGVTVLREECRDRIMSAMESQRPLKPAYRKRTTAQLSRKLGTVASACILNVLVNDRGALLRESVTFVEVLEQIWRVSGVAADAIWIELDHRLKLAEEVRESGVRVRKGGRFRSTKLP